MKILTELILTQRSFIITILAFALSPGAGYAAGSKKMISLDNTDFVVLISFLIFVGVLVYFKVPAIIASFDKRAEDIQNEIEKASEILKKQRKFSPLLRPIT